MTKVMIIGDMTLGESFAPPGFPGAPGHLPAPQPPGAVTPPIVLPPGVDNGLPPIPGQGLPPPDLGPGEIWPPLTPGEPKPKKAYAIVAIPGVGYRYTVVDLSLHPDHELPGGQPPRPDHELPDAPEPKRHR
jgi:hypothetical protein